MDTVASKEAAKPLSSQQLSDFAAANTWSYPDAEPYAIEGDPADCVGAFVCPCRAASHIYTVLKTRGWLKPEGTKMCPYKGSDHDAGQMAIFVSPGCAALCSGGAQLPSVLQGTYYRYLY